VVQVLPAQLGINAMKLHLMNRSMGTGGAAGDADAGTAAAAGLDDDMTDREREEALREHAEQRRRREKHARLSAPFSPLQQQLASHKAMFRARGDVSAAAAALPRAKPMASPISARASDLKDADTSMASTLPSASPERAAGPIPMSAPPPASVVVGASALSVQRPPPKRIDMHLGVSALLTAKAEVKGFGGSSAAAASASASAAVTGVVGGGGAGTVRLQGVRLDDGRFVRDHGPLTRSFRAGFGPGGLLVHTVHRTSIVIKRININPQFHDPIALAPGAAAVGPHEFEAADAFASHPSAVRGASAALVSPGAAHAAHLEHIQAALRVHLAHYKVDRNRHDFGRISAANSSAAAAGAEVKALALVPDTNSTIPSALHALCERYAEAIDRLRASGGSLPGARDGLRHAHLSVQLSHAHSVWRLVQALWAPEHGPNATYSADGAATPLPSPSPVPGAGSAAAGGGVADMMISADGGGASASASSAAQDVSPLRSAAYAEIHSRLSAVSDWLMSTIRPDVDSELRANAHLSSAPAEASAFVRSAGAAARRLLSSPNDAAHVTAVADVLTLLTANQIARAMETATRIGDVRLALLLAQAGEDLGTQQDIAAQIKTWRKAGTLLASRFFCIVLLRTAC
jgi:hypothetical protein